MRRVIRWALLAALWGCSGSPAIAPPPDAASALDAAGHDAADDGPPADDTPVPAAPWRSRAFPETWNTRGTGMLRAYNAGPGWVVGTGPTVRVESSLTTALGQIVGAHTAPEDDVEGLGVGATLQPASLYEDQRRRRLARAP